eukprot:g32724.t1
MLCLSRVSVVNGDADSLGWQNLEDIPLLVDILRLRIQNAVEISPAGATDNVIELKLCVEGQAHRLNFLIYEVESYPDSGGIMMGEDGESELVEAINELLGDREHLELNEVLSSAMQVLKVDAPELELQDSDEDLVSDEGTGIMDDSYERCNRPGWKKMKWQERRPADQGPVELCDLVEDQRLSVREKRRKGEPPELTNEELKAAGEQIFNSKEAFSILSNELYSLQTQMTQGIQADAVDFNVYHWAVRLRGFEGCLAEDLKQLQASQGYDFVELRVFFKEDLHPFYPPSFALIRPRLQGRRSVRGDEIKKEREDRAVWSDLRLEPFRELMAELHAGAHVLDAGCGAGVPIAKAIVDDARQMRVTGVDISPRQIELAKQLVPSDRATFLCSDMTALDCEAESFDAICAFFSVFHLPRRDHAAFFARAASWLRPGGRFVFNLGAGFEDGDGECGLEMDFLGTTMVWSSYPRDDTVKLLSAAGLSLVKDELHTVRTGVDLHSARNDLEAHPEGAFSPLEQRLAQLQRLRGIKPQQLQVDVPGNAYEDDPWAQSSELAASCFGALGGKRSPAQTGEGGSCELFGWKDATEFVPHGI